MIRFHDGVKKEEELKDYVVLGFLKSSFSAL